MHLHVLCWETTKNCACSPLSIKSRLTMIFYSFLLYMLCPVFLKPYYFISFHFSLIFIRVVLFLSSLFVFTESLFVSFLSNTLYVSRLKDAQNYWKIVIFVLYLIYEDTWFRLPCIQTSLYIQGTLVVCFFFENSASERSLQSNVCFGNLFHWHALFLLWSS